MVRKDAEVPRENISDYDVRSFNDKMTPTLQNTLKNSNLMKTIIILHESLKVEDDNAGKEYILIGEK